jgi:hypothetical protein
VTKIKKELEEKEKLKFKLDADNKPKFMIRYNDNLKFWWDVMIICLAVYNAFVIPVSIAFKPELFQDPAFVFFDVLVDAIFFVDIMVNFNTTFYNNEGTEVYNRKVIAIKYIAGGRFFIDFISTIPMDDLFTLNSLEIFGILKLLRISRLNIIINKLNVKDEVKSMIKLMQLVFLLFIFLHVLGCIWFWIATVEELWVPPLDFIYYKTEIYSQTTSMKYWYAIYNAVLLLGGNEMGPRTDLELFFINMSLILCAIINANIFGEMAVLVQSQGRKSQMFQEQVDNANTAMKSMTINMQYQDEIREFIITTQGTKDQQDELAKFLDMISPSLKQKVAIKIFSRVVLLNKRLKNTFKKCL